jgi:hypothetical protein
MKDGLFHYWVKQQWLFNVIQPLPYNLPEQSSVYQFPEKVSVIPNPPSSTHSPGSELGLFSGRCLQFRVGDVARVKELLDPLINTVAL